MNEPEEVEFLGMKFKIATEEMVLAENDGRHLVACTRVADMSTHLVYPALAARRLQVKCTLCREVIWFDPKSSPYPPGAIRVCLQCLVGRTAEAEALLQG